jgi:hypothetical protein
VNRTVFFGIWTKMRLMISEPTKDSRPVKR